MATYNHKGKVHLANFLCWAILLLIAFAKVNNIKGRIKAASTICVKSMIKYIVLINPSPGYEVDSCREW